MATTYRIHPAIGVARLGNADAEDHFVGPEIPGRPSELDEKSFRKDGALRPQGARFRVFAYDGKGGCREVKLDKSLKAIEWTVHLANKKAYWFKFHGRTGDTSPDIDLGDVTPYKHSELRNKAVKSDKARRRQLIIDPVARTLLSDGKTASTDIHRGNSPDKTRESWPKHFVQGSQITRLGTLFVDSAGCLTVVGGKGHSGSVSKTVIGDFANNDGWFDDTSDGPVTAVLHFKDGSTKVAASSWVIVGPPRFAPAIKAVVTLYDAIYDVAVRYKGHRPSLFDPEKKQFQDSYRPSFTEEIYPILRAPELAHWTLAQVNQISLGSHHAWDYASLASGGASGGRNSPAAIVAWLREVKDFNNKATSRQMPRLHGDDGDDGVSFLTLTRTQLHLMQQWARGHFKKDWKGPVPAPPASTRRTAHDLDRAALENCIGGAFYPGIEAGWILRDPRIYLPGDPFRIKVLANGQEHEAQGLTPGSATMRSALPWQADFNDCVDQWWPSHRPTDVQTDTRPGTPAQKWDRGVKDEQEMVHKWFKLGFVLSAKRDGEPPFVERDRTLG
jgi:hypothetical protein